MIQVEHLTKYYGEFKAVDDLTFTVGQESPPLREPVRPYHSGGENPDVYPTFSAQYTNETVVNNSLLPR